MTLPITSFYQIVADPASGYLFISEGSSSINHILVTNLAGSEVTTIGGQDGVMGIALSADGSTLYAALSADHAVTAISTSTLQQIASYPVGDANTPQDIAVQSGKIWVSYNTGSVGAAAIGDIDLTAAAPAFETQSAMGGWYSAPQIAADPQDTGVLVAAEPEMDPSSVASYNVSVDPVTVTAQNGFFDNCENEAALAVVPGGSEFILACASPYAHYRYSTADLSQQGSYASTNYPTAVAIDASGDVAAGTSESSPKPDIYIYRQGGDTPLNTFDLENSGDGYLAARGLAWAPDGSNLFAVMSDYNSFTATTTYTLQVIPGPTLTQPDLTLTGPSTAQIAKSVTLTGSLTLPAGSLPAGTPITISRSEAGTTALMTFTVTTAADGSFSLTDTPPAAGQYTYTADYAGTSAIAPASASQTVTVTLIPATLTLTGPSSAQITKSVKLSGSLTLPSGPAPAGSAITITRSEAGSTSVKSFTVTTAANGSFGLSDTPPAAGKYTYTADYAGSSTITPASASQTVTVTLIPTSLTVTASPTRTGYESTIEVTAHLGTTYRGRTLSVYAQTLGSTSRKLLKTARVNSRGNLTVSYRAAHSTRFSAVFAGDSRYQPKTVSRAVRVRAKVSESLSGNYSSKRTSGRTYRLFHRTKVMHVHVTVAPNKHGECVEFDLQVYFQGAWTGTETSCATLGKTSKLTVGVRLRQASLGYHYRIRADYIPGSDTSNLGNDSSWQYFIVER